MDDRLPIDDERLSAYLDDELGREERAKVEELLKADVNYQAAMQEIRMVHEAVRGLPLVTPSPDLQARVLQGLPSARREPSQKEISPKAANAWTPYKYLGAIAALAAAIFAMLNVPHFMSSRSRLTLNRTESDVEINTTDSWQDTPAMKATEPEPSSPPEAQPAIANELDEARAMQQPPSSHSIMRAPPDPSSSFPAAETRKIETEDAVDMINTQSESVSSPIQKDFAVSVDDDASMSHLARLDAIADVRLSDPATTEQFFDTMAKNGIQLGGQALVARKQKQAMQDTTRSHPSLALGLDPESDSSRIGESDEQAFRREQGDNAGLGGGKGLPEGMAQQLVIVEADTDDLLVFVDELRQQSIRFALVAVDELTFQIPSPVGQRKTNDETPTQSLANPGAQQLRQSADTEESQPAGQANRMQLTASQLVDLQQQINDFRSANTTGLKLDSGSVATGALSRSQDQTKRQNLSQSALMQQLEDRSQQPTGRELGPGRVRILINVISP